MITLVNLYGPNEDRPMFYEDIKQKIKNLKMVMLLSVAILI